MSFTVTVTYAGSPAGAQLKVVVLTGATESGGVQASFAQSAPAAPNWSLTPNGSNSLPLFVIYDQAGGSSGQYAAEPGNALLDNGRQRNAFCDGYYSGSVTAGTAVALGAVVSPPAPFTAGSASDTAASTSRVLPVSSATAAGDTLLLLVSASGVTVSAVTDSKGNVYTLDTSSSSNPQTYFYRCPGAGGGAGGGATAALSTADTVTVTVSAGTAQVNMALVCAPGVGPLDAQSATTNGSAASTASVSATPTADGDWGICAAGTSLAETVSGPFTALGSATGSGPFALAGYNVFGAGTAGTAQSATFNWSGTASYRVKLWLFKAPGANNQEWASYEVRSSGAGTPVQDASTPAAAVSPASNTATTASFSPPAGAVLVALAAGNNAAADGTISDTSGLSLTWTLRSSATGGGGTADVWTATVPSGTSVSSADAARGTDAGELVTATVPAADAARGTDGGESAVGNTSPNDADAARGTDSGFTFVSDSDGPAGADSAVLRLRDGDIAGPAADRELTAWPGDSDAASGSASPASEAAYWSGPLSSADAAGPAADGPVPVRFARSDTETGHAADAGPGAGGTLELIDIYTFQPPFRFTGGQYSLVLPVRHRDPEIDEMRELALWRGERPDGTALRLYAAFAAGRLHFASDADRSGSREEGEAASLQVTVHIAPALPVRLAVG